MSKPVTPRPTDTELAILRVLWERGASTVRQVHEIMSVDRPTAYTTALKMLQIMTEKGLVEKDSSQRPQVYKPRLSWKKTQQMLLTDLMEKGNRGVTFSRSPSAPD